MANSPYVLPLSPVLASAPDARYRVDLDVLGQQLRPALLRRGPRLRAWCRSLLLPLRQNYAGFVAYVASTQRQLAFNGQRLLFEAALNDAFDPSPRRIRIVTSQLSLSQTYDYFIDEGQPLAVLYFDNEALYTPDSDYDVVEFNSQTDFTVQVPAALLPADPAAATRLTAAVEATVRRYKIATARHLIAFV